MSNPLLGMSGLFGPSYPPGPVERCIYCHETHDRDDWCPEHLAHWHQRFTDAVSKAYPKAPDGSPPPLIRVMNALAAQAYETFERRVQEACK